MSPLFDKKKDEKAQASDFEASMVLDTDVMKIVQATFKAKPFFWGVGRATETRIEVSASASVRDLGGSGDLRRERTYEWDYWINRDALPGFMPIETAKVLAGNTVSLVSGSTVVPTDLKLVQGEVQVNPKVSISASAGVVIKPPERGTRITASVSPSSISGSSTYTVAGAVTSESGNVAGLVVFIKVTNPDNKPVAVGSAIVVGVGTSGTYSRTFTAGGSESWIKGKYELLATFAEGGRRTPASAKANFEYAGFRST